MTVIRQVPNRVISMGDLDPKKIRSSQWSSLKFLTLTSLTRPVPIRHLSRLVTHLSVLACAYPRLLGPMPTRMHPLSTRAWRCCCIVGGADGATWRQHCIVGGATWRRRCITAAVPLGQFCLSFCTK
jgi:hypothetical protein